MRFEICQQAIAGLSQYSEGLGWRFINTVPVPCKAGVPDMGVVVRQDGYWLAHSAIAD